MSFGLCSSSSSGEKPISPARDGPDPAPSRSLSPSLLPAAFLLIEAPHLPKRRPQTVLGKGRTRDEAIPPVADLVAGGIDDRHLVGLEKREVGVAGGDEPVPLRVGEETLPTRVVGGGIRAPEELGEERRRQIVVRGPARHAARRSAGPSHEERRVELVVAEGRPMSREAQPVLVEFQAVV